MSARTLAAASLAFGILFAAGACAPAASDAAAPFDVVIANGHIIGGTGSPWYAADVGIRGGKIAAIGNLSAAAATRRLDAHGMVVAPGFIDMLGQSELTILVNPHLPSKIFQGITTEVTGEGSSAAPLNDSIVAADRVTFQHLNLTADWRTLGQYFARLEKAGMGINLASYVGATQVRRMVLAGAVCEHRRADRARHGGGEVRRHVRHAHALRGRGGFRGNRRGGAHWPRSA